MIQINGADEGMIVSVYSVSGQMVGSAIASGEQTIIWTSLRRGEIAIVKIGEKFVKVIMQ